MSVQEESIQVFFRHPTSDYHLAVRKGENITELCRRYRLPIHQLSTYRLNKADESAELIVDLFSPVEALVKESEYLMLRPSRNVDIPALLGTEKICMKKSDSSAFLHYIDRSESEFRGREIWKMLTPDECMDYVKQETKRALEYAGVSKSRMVVGVSGGGDSNALLAGLLDSGYLDPKDVLPVMFLGVPDWDRGESRARELCAEYGLELRVVSKAETGRRLGFSPQISDWYQRFEEVFPGEDGEYIGVWAVARVLGQIAQEENADYVVTGLNLEDCLADAYYSIISGHIPRAVPTRSIPEAPEKSFFFPLWLVPKNILDGCFPKYSLDNYEDRNPSHSFGRALYYYLAYQLVEAYPGAAQDFIRGISNMQAEKGSATYDQVGSKHPISEQRPLEEMKALSERLEQLFSAQNSQTNVN